MAEHRKAQATGWSLAGLWRAGASAGAAAAIAATVIGCGVTEKKPPPPHISISVNDFHHSHSEPIESRRRYTYTKRTTSTAAPTHPPTTTHPPPTTTTTVPHYSCHSTFKVHNPQRTHKKGLCMDDTTFRWCASQATALWPHTNEPVGAIRMFKPWQSNWGGDELRMRAWKTLASYVRKNKVEVLMGVQVTCNKEDDAQAWKWSLELMHMLGPENILAVASGNELELLFQKTTMPRTCIHELWEGGRYFQVLVDRARDMDRNPAFRKIRLTSVFGGYSKASWPFVDSPVSQVLTYVRNAHKKFGDRWVWSFNVYPFWDSKCGGAFKNVFAGMIDFRKRISLVTGRHNDTLWLTETGWSSSPPRHYKEPCPGYASKGRLAEYYEDFMQWQIGGPHDGHVDRAFYFTMRDAQNFDITESFGLIAQCTNQTCKVPDLQSTVVI